MARQDRFEQMKRQRDRQNRARVKLDTDRDVEQFVVAAYRHVAECPEFDRAEEVVIVAALDFSPAQGREHALKIAMLQAEAETKGGVAVNVFTLTRAEFFEMTRAGDQGLKDCGRWVKDNPPPYERFTVVALLNDDWRTFNVEIPTHTRAAVADLDPNSEQGRMTSAARRYFEHPERQPFDPANDVIVVNPSPDVPNGWLVTSMPGSEVVAMLQESDAIEALATLATTRYPDDWFAAVLMGRENLHVSVMPIPVPA